jgi:hypothetical protein
MFQGYRKQAGKCSKDIGNKLGNGAKRSWRWLGKYCQDVRRHAEKLTNLSVSGIILRISKTNWKMGPNGFGDRFRNIPRGIIYKLINGTKWCSKPIDKWAITISRRSACFTQSTSHMFNIIK